jgi:GrpB-like predicted nucleotidyltransferase (UPF0157 family)
MATERVHLKHYSRIWRWLFRKEKARLWVAMRGHVVDIQHVGSTAIPGMVAKPIIDIVAAVSDYERAFDCVTAIEGLGYEYRGENPESRDYSFAKGDPVRVHLYVVEKPGEFWERRIVFRDALIANPELARDYAELKRQLAIRFPDDPRAYSDGKAPFIDRVVELYAHKAGSPEPRRGPAFHQGTGDLGMPPPDPEPEVAKGVAGQVAAHGAFRPGSTDQTRGRGQRR